MTVVAGSANWIAAVRARESRRPDRLFDDPFAERLAGERGFAAMAASERASGGENAFIPVRVRWFDDAVLRAVADGVRQVVLLGAGLDTRPYRLDLPGDLDWFELDRPEVFEAKAAVLGDPASGGAVPRCRRGAVEADLAGDWASALVPAQGGVQDARPRHQPAGPGPAGFDPGRRTLWLAEGLFFYLAEESIVALLRAAGGLCGPDSLLLADIMSAGVTELPAMRSYRDHCARRGLPPPYGCDDPGALLLPGGWRLDAITTPGAPDANYGRLPTVAPTGSPNAPRPGTVHLVTGRRVAE
ncbi:SAM-dependent methyltransferase [Rugosimonospora acidiphila]|uniref:S-adenosyl-L-methionine-dependent methyltransferase n=1 Tax=Rugosimonospora acidiphila TaxID=556531 RepID=A0ABP9SM93_9ACTN